MAVQYFGFSGNVVYIPLILFTLHFTYQDKNNEKNLLVTTVIRIACSTSIS